MKQTHQLELSSWHFGIFCPTNIDTIFAHTYFFCLLNHQMWCKTLTLITEQRQNGTVFMHNGSPPRGEFHALAIKYLASLCRQVWFYFSQIDNPNQLSKKAPLHGGPPIGPKSRGLYRSNLFSGERPPGERRHIFPKKYQGIGWENCRFSRPRADAPYLGTDTLAQVLWQRPCWICE